MVKFQFYGLKSFVMGFKLNFFYFFFTLLSSLGVTQCLDYALSFVRSYHRVFFVIFNKLKLGN